jgi:hypothetical protein
VHIGNVNEKQEITWRDQTRSLSKMARLPTQATF